MIVDVRPGTEKFVDPGREEDFGQENELRDGDPGGCEVKAGAVVFEL